ncbi:MAG TPA: homoserine dehydrogenase [Methanoculleus sp.]|nr:homoserine dehydrogenase [Methanoculleus sp.]
MRIAMLGFGSVGRGIAEAVSEKDLGLSITAVADSRSGIIDADGIDIRDVLERKRTTGLCGTPGITAEDVIESGVYDVLVEVTPTNADSAEPALGYITCALTAGRHVVTSNKGPVALRYDALMQLAVSRNVQLRYEATVCGAIPLIQALEIGLAGNTITALNGVFNGTCNYILTRMTDEGLSYSQALLEARELGYAEADPTYDVKGIDAAIKLVILANSIWGLNVSLDDVDITGIDGLTTDALALAEDLDCTIRLIGEIIPEKRILKVSPRVLSKDHSLVVRDTLNAVTVETDMAGEITLIGRGAGSRETASAIIADILFIRDCYVERT